ncbi:hypothetical protein EG835_04490 [bacterium]|nr:hypothetical protein [bacterium]
MLAQVVFFERDPAYVEVQYLDEVEGEYYVAGGFAHDGSHPLAEQVARWGELHDLGSVEWEVRSADWELLALGRFDGRG